MVIEAKDELLSAFMFASVLHQHDKADSMITSARDGGGQPIITGTIAPALVLLTQSTEIRQEGWVFDRGT